MVIKLYIFLLLILPSTVSAQVLQENGYKLFYPENISSNSAFDISIVASNPYNNNVTLELYFVLPGRITFKNLLLHSVYNETNIPCNQINIDGISGEVYKAVISLSKYNISSKTFFQLLFSFKAENAKNANFQFSGIFKANGKTAGYIQTSDNFNSDDSLKFASVSLQFYKPQKYAVNAILFNPGSELSINLTDIDVNNLLTEFWIKIDGPNNNFLTIINKQTNRNLFDISTNPFQMITVKSENRSNEEVINPYFLSGGTWYHIAVLISFNTQEVNFYCNSTLINKNKLAAFLNAGDLIWKFENNSQDSNFILDVFRAVALNNNINVSFFNKNYLNFIADSSRVLYQFNFDNEDELSLAEGRIDLSYSSVNFLKSDAPIFARAPELNIEVLGNSYELTWTGGDYKQARVYVLEKSVNNSDYTQVSIIQPENYHEKNYSILDEKDPDAEVVYYRVKQINFDGTVVYSSQVKIGQGDTEPFVLEQNYPNPFNPRTSIVIDLLEDSDVDITIFNLEGKEIAKLFKGFLARGEHKFSFDASELSSGIYLYKVSTPNYSDTKKMILTK